MRETEINKLFMRITNAESEIDLLCKELISSLKKNREDTKFIKETGESLSKLTAKLKVSSYVLFGTAIIHGIWCLSTIVKDMQK